MPETLVIHWFPVPAATLARAKQNGFQRVPTELALRPQTGEDLEKCLQGMEAMKQMANLRARLVKQTLCGVNYDDKRDTSKRLPVSRGSDNPDLITDNIWATLPASIVTLLQSVYSDINEPDEEELADFRAGRKMLVT
jgi:hypothetical protein